MQTMVATMTPGYEFARSRTVALLESIEKLPQPQDVLNWRPQPGRANIGWQLMHIAVTEEVFATERLAPAKAPRFAELWPSFRGGSIPADQSPDIAVIRKTLSATRASLLETLSGYGDDRLEEIPLSLAARGVTVRTVLHLLLWHEGHHQGQAHLTMNLFKQVHNLEM